jgi:hypothetical protein
MSRLPWQPYPDANGFIAYPDGEDMKHRYACIWPEGGLYWGRWRWLARIGHPAPRENLASGIVREGLAPTKQEAADRATEAWPEVVAEAERSPGNDKARRSG